MRNHSNQLAVLLQARQCSKCHIKRFFIQRAKAFVQKQGIYPHILAGHARQAQRQRKTDNKAFTARQIFRRTDFACLIVVQHIQLQRFVHITHQQITVSHLLQSPVGMSHHQLEGQPLGKVAELLAIGRADQLMQVVPAAAFLFLPFQHLPGFSLLIPCPGIVLLAQSQGDQLIMQRL